VIRAATLIAIAAVAACNPTIEFHIHQDAGAMDDRAGGDGPEARLDLGSDLGVDQGWDEGADVGMDMSADVGVDVDVGQDLGGDVAQDVGVDMGRDMGGGDVPPAPGTCNVDAQCPPGLRCNGAAKTCVVCLGNGDCTSPEVCDTSTHRCVRCLGDGNCPAGQVCSQGHRCVTTCVKNGPPTCPSSASNCEDDTGTGLCAPCDDNLVCPTGSGGTICLRPEGVCVQCTSDADCSGSHCDLVTNRCVACTDNSQCTQPAAPFCNPATGTCVGAR
jgi:hypothetical protein